MTPTARLEVEKHDIRTNTLAPGLVETDRSSDDVEGDETWRSRIALGDLVEPDGLVGAAVFLALDASRYRSGTTLPVDGGYVAR